MLARDIMDTRFHTINPEANIADAVSTFQEASQAEKKSIFGLMVTDDNDKLVGMLSMHDILLFIQPKHTHIWGDHAAKRRSPALCQGIGRKYHPRHPGIPGYRGTDLSILPRLQQGNQKG